MPIRSPRGRAAAYRTLWQWPLRSPARLAVTALIVVGVVAGVSVGIAQSGVVPRPPDAQPTTPPPTPVATAPTLASATVSPTATQLPPVPELSPTTLPTAAAPAAALQTVDRWAAAWVRPPEGTTAAQWLDGLRPTTTPEYLGVLAGVDPANIPATRVTGSAQAVLVARRSVRVRVPTDAVTLVVTAVDTDQGWRVSGYDRV